MEKQISEEERDSDWADGGSSEKKQRRHLKRKKEWKGSAFRHPAEPHLISQEPNAERKKKHKRKSDSLKVRAMCDATRGKMTAMCELYILSDLCLDSAQPVRCRCLLCGSFQKRRSLPMKATKNQKTSQMRRELTKTALESNGKAKMKYREVRCTVHGY